MHTATAAARAAPTQAAAHTPAAAAAGAVLASEPAQPEVDAPVFAGPLPTRLPAVPRLIAIGDVHGDLSKAIRAFQ